MIYDFYPLIGAISANILAQLIKPITYYFKTKEVDLFQIFAAGGFPSSHTSTMSALALAIGIKDGFDSSTFMISFILLLIISYDATNVRLYAGKHIELTQRLVMDLKELTKIKLDDPIYFKKMKKVLGHERIEVFGGFLLGIIVSLVLYYICGGQ